MLHLFKNFNKVKLYSLYVSICTYVHGGQKYVLQITEQDSESQRQLSII